MVLQTQNTEQYGDGPMVIKYLSTGQVKALVSAGVYGPCFSPDGRQIAYSYNRQNLMVMNVDGTNQKTLCQICRTSGSKEPYFSWCTNGYIYWSQCDANIYRIKADGSQTTASIVFTSSFPYTQYREVHNIQVDSAGKRCAWTKPPPDKNGNSGAWSNSILDFAQGTELEFTQGCQIAISPSGTLLTRSDGTHQNWYIMKWGTTTNAAWTDCGSSSCANYVYYGGNPANASHYMIRWSRNDSSKILFTTETRNYPGPGYLYDWVTKATPELIGDGFVWDYYKTEITNPSVIPALKLTPANIIVNLTQGKTADSVNVLASLVNSTATIGTLSIGTVPSWLRVTIKGATLTNKIIVSALSGFRTYDTTVTVRDASSGLSSSYQFTLNYVALTANPITIFQPAKGAHYRVGDSLVVRYSAVCESVPSVTISLSLDSGKTYTILTGNNSRPCGTNMSYSWKIAPTLTVSGSARSSISQKCFLLVSEYNGPSEAEVGAFSIDSASAVIRPVLSSRISRFEFGIDAGGNMRVVSPESGIIEFFDLQGSVLAKQRVFPHRQVFIASSNKESARQGGMRFLRFTNDDRVATVIPIIER
jgi:hypothetical protein